MTKIGRNERCPCGSGRKYKKCCLNAEQPENTPSATTGDTYSQVAENILFFLNNRLDPVLLYSGITDFFQDYADEDSYADLVEDLEMLFWPWLFFTWVLEPHHLHQGTGTLDVATGKTLGELFVDYTNPKEEEKRWIQAYTNIPYSFWEVKAVTPGRSFEATDIFTGEHREIHDEEVSQDLSPNTILYANPFEYEGITQLRGMAPVGFSLQSKPVLIDLRSAILEHYETLDTGVLRQCDHMLRRQFFALFFQSMNDLEVTNGDGDPIKYLTLIYTIESPAEVFEALLPLCGEEASREELLAEDAKYDEHGNLFAVDFLWFDDTEENGLFDKSIVADIRIEGQRMEVEVNSNPRGQAIHKAIVDQLGSKVRYQETVESEFELGDELVPGESEALDAEMFRQAPELLEVVAQKLQQHWDGWADVPLPALNGETPREAVQTATGAEKVQALLVSFEEHPSMPGLVESHQQTIDKLRVELGLTDG